MVVGISEDSWEFKNDAYIISIDKDGGFLWDKLVITSGYDRFNEIIATSDSNYLIGGELNGLAWLVKMNENGDTLWTKSYGNSLGAITSLQELSSTNIIISGNTVSSSDYNFYILETNQNGDTIWTHKYKFDTPMSPWYESSRCIRQTYDGGFILSTGGIGGYGEPFSFIVKTDHTGDTLWTINCSNDLNLYSSSFPDILVDSDTLYFIGVGSIDTIWQDVILIKMKSDGEVLWIKSCGEYTNNLEKGYSGVFSENGNILIAGKASTTSGDHIYILEIDKNGNLIWDKTYGGMEMSHTALSIGNTLEDNYIIAGYRYPAVDFFVLKLGESPSQINPLVAQNENSLRIIPNPVKSEATINFIVFEKDIYTISVFDMKGNKIETLVEKELAPSSYKFPLNAGDLSNGVYIINLKSGSSQNTQKIIISR